MVVLGLFLLLISGVLTAAMVLQNTDLAQASVFGQAVSNVTVGGLFAAGAITGAVALLGLLMMLAGARRRRTRRVGLKRQVRDVRDERESLAEENARLRHELAARSDMSDVSNAPAYPEATDAEAGRHAESDTHTGLFRR